MSFVKIENQVGWSDTEWDTEWDYVITDNDFVEEGVVLGTVIGVAGHDRIWVAVIDTYEKRNLNVAYNLLLLLQKEAYTPQDIIRIHNRNKEIIPRYKQYEEGIEKYLMLL